MSQWKKPHEKMHDQRDCKLPPTWLRKEKANNKQIQGAQVYQSSNDLLLVDTMIERVDKAGDKIVLCSFLFADEGLQEALLRAAKRGVRVYLMLASEARLKQEPKEDNEFERHVFEEHKKMLDRLAGFAMIRSADEFHAKVILVDPGTPEQWGMLLTANLTREALSRNEELGVVLTGEEVDEVFDKLRWALWERSKHETMEPGKLSTVKPLQKVEQPEDSEQIVWTSEGRSQIKERALALIQRETQKLIVSSFGWQESHEVVEALCRKAESGVDVIVLSRVRSAAMPALLALARAGAQVVGFKWLHAKAVWTSQAGGLVTSANFEKYGMDEGFELGVMLEGERNQQLGIILESWSELAPWELKVAPLMGELEGDVKIWHREQLIGERILGEREVSLGQITVESVEMLDTVVMPEVPSDDLPKMAHQIIYKWTASVPTLHRQAEEVFQKGGKGSGKKNNREPYVPPVFNEPGGRRVIAIDSEEQLEAAKELKVRLSGEPIVQRIG